MALHYDGSKNKDANGYSCGYKPETNQLFKENMAISYGKLCGFKRRPDNYTTGLKKYYGYNHTKADFYLVLEHGFGTNKKERNWMFANIDNIAKHHTDFIVNFLKDLKAQKMSRGRTDVRLENYNLDKIDRLVTIALIADDDTIRVPKKLLKLTRQYLKAEHLYDIIKIKTT